mmetsp:Transcript_16466/g.58449  ORF Transcript_16466/g.58449 Transcript_16466/m.58449 type:complete len:98 (-) Transcript_16466:1613-1906(-)
MRSSCVPCSATTPPRAKTAILSAWRTVERRCAMTSVVRSEAYEFKEDMISASVSESRAEVASSKHAMGASFRIARASATRCFSPPLSFKPRSPTTVE